MIYKEEIRDLFSVSDDYILAHCISADFALGAGIAVRFRQMGVKDELLKQYKKDYWKGSAYMIPTFSGRPVCNLVTKEKYWHKPTYDSLEQSLETMKQYIQRYVNSHKIAMPLIGCGLDGLRWDFVRDIIYRVFADTDIEILICKLK